MLFDVKEGSNRYFSIKVKWFLYFFTMSRVNFLQLRYYDIRYKYLGHWVVSRYSGLSNKRTSALINFLENYHSRSSYYIPYIYSGAVEAVQNWMRISSLRPKFWVLSPFLLVTRILGVQIRILAHYLGSATSVTNSKSSLAFALFLKKLCYKCN